MTADDLEISLIRPGQATLAGGQVDLDLLSDLVERFGHVFGWFLRWFGPALNRVFAGRQIEQCVDHPRRFSGGYFLIGQDLLNGQPVAVLGGDDTGVRIGNNVDGEGVGGHIIPKPPIGAAVTFIPLISTQYFIGSMPSQISTTSPLQVE